MTGDRAGARLLLASADPSTEMPISRTHSQEAIPAVGFYFLGGRVSGPVHIGDRTCPTDQIQAIIK
jgi:hypothetical protein